MRELFLLRRCSMSPLSKSASEIFSDCRLCPHLCSVNRTAGEKGFCNAGTVMEVASAVVHKGEEPFFTGNTGTGNIFFNHCSMACVYCQNHQISRHGGGKLYSPDELACVLLSFEQKGCPSVGFVSPGHYLPLVAEAVTKARNMGLTVPVIWNSNGYETLEYIRMLEGIVDIYLPDIKYMDQGSGMKYSAAPVYPEAARAAVTEMFRQKGPLSTRNGLATEGLCVRHLVLPNNLSNTDGVLEFIASLSTEIPVSLMSQYNPLWKAENHILLSRKLQAGEYWRAVEKAEALGLHRTLIQEPEQSPESYLPDFIRDDVFNDSEQQETF